VDRADLFGWHQEGIVRMSRASLEAQAAIHLRSEVMDQVSLRRNGDLVFETTRNSESRLLPVGESMDRIAELANSWTVGLPRGMVQIDEICRRLREGYVLDREWVSGEDVLIPVEDFLFGSRRGPEYQFATAAVVMLRSLGYTARLVSGFYADPENYDPRKRKTLVRAENSHFWCEVFVGRAENGNLHLNEVELLLFRPAATTPQRIRISGARSLWVGGHGQLWSRHRGMKSLNRRRRLANDCGAGCCGAGGGCCSTGCSVAAVWRWYQPSGCSGDFCGVCCSC
jgi:hypothetical protein